MLDERFKSVKTEVVPIRWIIPFEPAEAAAFFAENAGPLRLLLAKLTPRYRTALLDDFTAFFVERNDAPPGSGRAEVVNEYLRMTAARR